MCLTLPLAISIPVLSLSLREREERGSRRVGFQVTWAGFVGAVRRFMILLMPSARCSWHCPALLPFVLEMSGVKRENMRR